MVYAFLYQLCSCVFTCSHVCTYVHIEARCASEKPSSINLHLIFWDRVLQNQVFTHYRCVIVVWDRVSLSNLAGLQFTRQTRLASNSYRSAYFCLRVPGLKVWATNPSSVPYFVCLFACLFVFVIILLSFINTRIKKYSGTKNLLWIQQVPKEDKRLSLW